MFAAALSLSLTACAGSLTDTTNYDASIVIKGSDTEVQLVSNLAQEFSEMHPDADMSVTGGGSAVGIAALINGEADLANSSRAMKEEELQQAEDRGLSVQEFILARDGLSVIVHPESPISTLSMAQLRGLYDGTIKNWKAVGGPDAPVVLYGRQSTSGTFGFFRDVVVQADYAPTMRQMEGTQAIVDGVKADRNSIGYVGVGYIKDRIGELKVLTISDGGAPMSSLDKEAVLAGRYPIARPIYQYLPHAPAKDSALHEFLLFEASDAGQAIVEETGFYPTTAEDQAANAAFFESIK
ncbi:PstS family phosphate ABC transporter substrate-binding protein [Candidatus Peregrinibacteria bacterium]|nr:PstS family phosphate ABC transporter substrate-binding protein [Candidatus Peregrinibacteria bacterium]